MAVVSVRKIASGRGGAVGAANDDDEVVVWRVVTDSPFDTKATIMASGRLPGYLSQHDENVFLTLRRMSLEQEHAATIWIARGEYSSKPLSEDELQAQAFPNPLARPAMIRGRFHNTETVAAEGFPIDDETGENLVEGQTDPLRVITNSAGDPPDQALRVDEAMLVIEFQKNYQFLPDWLWTHNNGVNASPLTITFRSGQSQTFPARSVRACEFHFSDLKVENGVGYFEVGGVLRIVAITTARPQGWDLRFPDVGFHYRTGAALSTKREILLSKDEKPSVPQLLDGNGGILDDLTQVKWRRYRWYEDMDLSVLPLDGSSPFPLLA
jgi:hypothetical protein